MGDNAITYVRWEVPELYALLSTLQRCGGDFRFWAFQCSIAIVALLSLTWCVWVTGLGAMVPSLLLQKISLECTGLYRAYLKL